MSIQPVSTWWKHTSNPINSYQPTKPPHPPKMNQPLDEVVVSNRSYQRLHNLHSQVKPEPINDAKEAQEMMGMIRFKIIEQSKTTLYIHDVTPNTTVLNLLSPARPFSTTVDIQIQDFSKKAP